MNLDLLVRLLGRKVWNHFNLTKLFLPIISDQVAILETRLYEGNREHTGNDVTVVLRDIVLLIFLFFYFCFLPKKKKKKIGPIHKMEKELFLHSLNVSPASL